MQTITEEAGGRGAIQFIKMKPGGVRGVPHSQASAIHNLAAPPGLKQCMLRKPVLASPAGTVCIVLVLPWLTLDTGSTGGQTEVQ